MRLLREINWWQLVNSYRWIREHGYLPKELVGYTTYGHTKEKYVELFAYIMENIPEEIRRRLPSRFEQFYNWIFMDEHVGSRTGPESSFREVIKNSRFGHSEGTQAYIIDEMLLKGRNSYFDIAKAIGSTEARVRSHVMDLKRKFKDEVEIISIRKGTHCVYYVKEKKKDAESKRGNKKPIIQSIDGTEIGPESSEFKRHTRKNKQDVL